MSEHSLENRFHQIGPLAAISLKYQVLQFAWGRDRSKNVFLVFKFPNMEKSGHAFGLWLVLQKYNNINNS